MLKGIREVLNFHVMVKKATTSRAISITVYEGRLQDLSTGDYRSRFSSLSKSVNKIRSVLFISVLDYWRYELRI